MNYTPLMIFEWDEDKSDACFLERGFDFAYATQAFFDPDHLIRADTRYVYGEDRYRLLGKLGQRLFVVVHTPREKHHAHHFGAQGQPERGRAL